jgi:MFS transporter, DHA1 family, multidrug resistance protein
LTAAPDARRILVWMCVLITVNQLGFGGIVPAMALYARSFDVPHAAIGVAIGVYGLARFLVAIPSGQLADRFGRRAVLALGGVVSAGGNLVCAWAPNFAMLVTGRFIAGAGAALVLTTGLIVLADITTPSHRGRTMSIYQGAFLFAVGVGPLPGGLLAERFGLHAPFLSYAGAGLVAAAVGWIRIPETRSFRTAIEAGRQTPLPSFALQVRLLTTRTGFVLVSLLGFVNALARTGGLFTVIPVLARDRLDLGPDRIGFGLAIASIVGLGLAYPGGMLVDRYGRKAVIVPSTMLCGLSMMLFLLAPTYGWFLVACAAWSVAAGASGAAPAAYAADIAPPGMNAAAISAYRMLSDFGYVVGPIALGLVTDGLGAGVALTATAVLLVAVSLLFARGAPETWRAA